MTADAEHRQSQILRSIRSGIWSLVIAACLASSAAWAQPKPMTLVLLGYGDTPDESREILASVEAALTDLDAKAEMVWEGKFPTPDAARARAVEIAGERQAQAVFWQEAGMLLIYVPAQDEGSFLTRPIEPSKESAGHAVGLIMSSAVASLMTEEDNDADNDHSAEDGEPMSKEGADAPAKEKPSTVFTTTPDISKEAFRTEPPKRETLPDDAEEETVADEGSLEAPEAGDTGAPNKPTADDKPPKTPAARDRDGSSEVLSSDGGRMKLLAAYGLDVTSDRHPAVHGGRFGLGIRLVKGLLLTMDYTVSQRLEASPEAAEATLELRRHPIAVGLGWTFPLKRWRLGADLLLELDAVGELAASTNNAITATGATTRIRTSIIPEVTAGLRIAGPLFGAFRLGMRVLTDKPRYRAEVEGHSSVIYEPWRLQVRATIGAYVELF